MLNGRRALLHKSEGVSGMVGRFLAVLAGLAGAAAGSQAPNYTAHYMQNLEGRIAELRPIVAEFDADVARYGYTRDAAMLECETATGLLDALCGGYATTIERFEILLEHQTMLKGASDYVRPLILLRDMADSEIVRELNRSVMKEYEPAIPTTLDGAAYAGGGFAALWGALSFIFGLLGSMFGGRRYA